MNIHSFCARARGLSTVRRSALRMPAAGHLTPALAALVTGAALYFSSGVIDVVELGGSVVRVAFRPGWPVLLGYLAIAVVVVLGLGALYSRRKAHDAPFFGELVMPLLALIVLALPYLPVLPDWLPALQVLAGPLVGVIWLAVAGLQLWVLAQARVIAVPAADRWPLMRSTAVIFGATLVVSGIVAWKLMASPAFPGGDEPHYLVMAQSMWRDGDLNIFNNHQQGDYYEYSSIALAPHYLQAGIDGGIYSVHPVLMPVLMAPVYAAGGYQAVVAALVLVSSVAATLAWRWVRHTIAAAGAATFAWAAVAGSSPYLLNTFTVYPETCAALAVMIAFVLAVSTVREQPGLVRYLAIGLACAALPWLSTKYAPMSAALMLVAYGRLGRRGIPALARSPQAWAMSVVYGLSLLGWFWFFYAYWGTPSPTAPYGEHGQTSPIYLLRGVPGLLFDQEYGLLAFAPIYILAATGLWIMWHRGGELRRQALEVALVFGALLATVGAFWIWWGGSAAPGRPLVSALLLLALPIAVAFQDAQPGSARRASHYLLLLVGIGIAVTLTVAQNGLLIDNGRDGTAALLEYWLPQWSLWALAPAYTFHDPPLTYLHTLCWLVIAAAAAAALSAWRSASSGVNALVAAAVFGLALLTISLTMPLLPAGPARPPITLAARSRLPALDGFDAKARPSAVIYDPMRTVAPADVLPQLGLGVTPGLRADRTPLRLIHNGRFSLPAGSYALEIRFGSASAPATLGLQVGRLGGPLESWDVQPRSGESWRAAIHLPVDANFVGFVGSPELERSIDRIAITPTAIVDAGARPQVAAVLSARKYAEATFYFHDEHLYPEPQGMWTRGGRIASVTVVPTASDTASPVVRVNSGSRGNTFTLSTPGWQQAGTLVPGQVAQVQLPPAERGVIPLTITAANSYRPRELEPTSRDPRTLGVWLEFARP
jgi:hypothetical protein